MYIEIKRIRQIGENIKGQLFIDSRADLGQNLQFVCDTLENLHSSLPLGLYRIEIQKCPFRSRKMPLVIISSSDPLALPLSPDCQALTASPDCQALTPSPDCQALPPSCLCSMCAKADYVGVNSTPHQRHAKGEALFCPMIAPGNGIHNRHDGSIIVGNRGARGLLLHPMTTFDRLYERIRRSAERGNEIKLTIS